jgi:arylsulfatase A-like enzyme
MGRKILFITTDQQRYDTLGCNGSVLARTPVLDQLAADGVRYTRAAPTSVVCMPSRSSMLTGQFPTTHGAWMNGVPLAVDAPSVAATLHDAGYRTGLFGKAHFEPFLDVFGRFTENALANLGVPTVEQPWYDGRRGPHRGFERLEMATHGAAGMLHYARWIAQEHPEMLSAFYQVLDSELNVNAAGGGDTGAPQVKHNVIPREWYHTDWVADRTIQWLQSLDQDDDWFCWMSFPDPHHPWDPPQSELHRVPWRDVDLPEGYIGDAATREAVLDQKARHWRMWYDGRLVSNYEAPAKWVPATLTPDQVREVNALNAVEMELIDEAIGRVVRTLHERGWDEDVDIIFTTDHGELQGDFGLLFKGPYHVDGLMRLPLIWRPAPAAGVAPAVVETPVSLVSLAATFLDVAGLPTPLWSEGRPLPTTDHDAETPGHSVTEWDSALFGVDVHVRTVVTDRYLYTRYLPGSVHDGSERELYDLVEDPLQRVNRASDPSLAGEREVLDSLLDEHDARPHQMMTWAPVVAPV